MEFLTHVMVIAHVAMMGLVVLGLILLVRLKAGAVRRFVQTTVVGLVTLLALEAAGFAYLRMEAPRVGTRGSSSSGAMLWLADFETEDEARVRWRVHDAVITSTTGFATHGARGARLTLKDGQTPKATMSDALWFDWRRRDWSRYAALAFEIKNLQSSQERLMVQLKDRRGRIYKEELWIPGGMTQSVRVRLDRVRPYLDLRRITELTLFQWQPGRTTTFDLDAIRLESPQDVVTQAPSVIEGRAAAPRVPGPLTGSEATWKLFGWTSGLVKVLRDPAAYAGRTDGPLVVELARGEAESAQLILLGGRFSTTVTVAVEPLRHVTQDALLPADAIQARAVGYVTTRRPSYPVTSVGEWPDVLERPGPIELSAGHVQPVWITVHVPPQSLPGRYEGALTVTDAQGRRERIAFHVTVWDFTLPRASGFHTAFDLYPGRLEQAAYDPGIGVAIGASPLDELVKRSHLQMLSVRLSPIWNADPTKPQFAWDVKTYLEAGLGMFGVGSRGGSFDNNWPTDPVELEQAMVWYRQAELELRFLRLIGQAYVYVYDEPAPGDPHVAQVLALLRREAPQLKRLVVMHEAPNPQLHAEWLRDVDILCLRNAAWHPEWAAEYRAMGKELWMYVSSPAPPFPNLVIDVPGIAHRIIPWTAWKAGATGLLYWCVNFWNGDPRINPASFQPDQNGNGFLFYPGAEGPLPSMRVEMLRDGIEDYEYLIRLQQLVEAAKARGAVEPKRLERAQQLLAIDPALVASVRDYATDPELLLRNRRAIAEMIETLQ